MKKQHEDHEWGYIPMRHLRSVPTVVWNQFSDLANEFGLTRGEMFVFIFDAFLQEEYDKDPGGVDIKKIKAHVAELREGLSSY